MLLSFVRMEVLANPIIVLSQDAPKAHNAHMTGKYAQAGSALINVTLCSVQVRLANLESVSISQTLQPPANILMGLIIQEIVSIQIRHAMVFHVSMIAIDFHARHTKNARLLAIASLNELNEFRNDPLLNHYQLYLEINYI